VTDFNQIATQANTHVLSAGDSLSQLAHDAYGRVGEFRAIADKNDIDIFATLPTGAQIDLPSLAEIDREIERVTGQATSFIDSVAEQLDLSNIRQQSANGGLEHQLIDWIL